MVQLGNCSDVLEMQTETNEKIAFIFQSPMLKYHTFLLLVRILEVMRTGEPVTTRGVEYDVQYLYSPLDERKIFKEIPFDLCTRTTKVV